MSYKIIYNLLAFHSLNPNIRQVKILFYSVRSMSRYASNNNFVAYNTYGTKCITNVKRNVFFIFNTLLMTKVGKGENTPTDKFKHRTPHSLI